MLKVLYVDDEPDIREVALMALALDPGLETESCENGREGLAKAAAWRPDIILLDVMMPELDGPATLEALRADPATAAIPVVFITARVQAREINAFLALGAAWVIAKPFDPLTLAGEVRAIAGRAVG